MIRNHLLALVSTAALLPAQCFFDYYNPPAWMDLQGGGSVSEWESYCPSCGNPFHDCVIVRPEGALAGTGRINTTLNYLMLDDRYARSTDPCDGRDDSLNCATAIYFGCVVGFGGLNEYIPASVTNTVDAYLTVDGSTETMTTWITGIQKFAVAIPNDPIWIGVDLYFQGFTIFRLSSESTDRLMMAHRAHCEVHS